MYGHHELFLVWYIAVTCMKKMHDTLQHTATHCNILQHTATHCNRMQYLCDLYGGGASGLSRTQSRHPPACCIVFQCVAEWCRVLQCVAVCCSVLQCVAVCCSVLQCVEKWVSRTQNRHPPVCCIVFQCVAECCRVLQCVAVCCSVSQCIAVCHNLSFVHTKSVSTCQSDKTPLSEYSYIVCSGVLQCVAVCCSVLQCVAACCSLSQGVAVWHNLSFVHTKSVSTRQSDKTPLSEEISFEISFVTSKIRNRALYHSKLGLFWRNIAHIKLASTCKSNKSRYQGPFVTSEGVLIRKFVLFNISAISPVTDCRALLT